MLFGSHGVNTFNKKGVLFSSLKPLWSKKYNMYAILNTKKIVWFWRDSTSANEASAARQLLQNIDLKDNGRTIIGESKYTSCVWKNTDNQFFADKDYSLKFDSVQKLTSHYEKEYEALIFAHIELMYECLFEANKSSTHFVLKHSLCGTVNIFATPVATSTINTVFTFITTDSPRWLADKLNYKEFKTLDEARIFFYALIFMEFRSKYIDETK